MNAIEKIKAVKELRQIRKELSSGSLNAITKIKAVKRLRQLRALLGVDMQNERDESILKPLELPDNAKRGDLRRVAKQWLSENVQGKTITTSDGKKVHFNRNESTDHLSFNASRSKLHAKAVTFVMDVFKTGNFVGKEALSHERKDNFIAFHKYQKWVEIDDYRVLLETAAGELPNGELEAVEELIAYNQRLAGKQKVENAPASIETAMDSSQAAGSVFHASNHTAVFDKAQIYISDLVGYVCILQILDPQGNDVTDTYQETDTQPKTSTLYTFDDTQTKTQRQRANNAVFALLDKADAGELTIDNITTEQKAILAQYSGSGGGLKARDGKTGSAHEYYTPAPVASAMWDVVKEMGFGGGKVLDPCGGSGIFGAFAPENAVVQVVEMDETSATVNKLVNGSERYHVDVASFEERAQSIPDNSVDAIVTNVPFGDVSLRKHRNKDSKYRKENLQTYFVLRSLDKLKPSGLAAFIVPSSFLDGKGGKAENARVLTSQMAEFIGAYRLPNSVFGTAGADVATDILFYRKYSQDTAEKIAQLQAQNPDVLTEARVMWDDYINGKYFKLSENKKFILGEEGETESWRTDENGDKKKVYAVINNDSVANIAQAIKRFHGSRIDWALLDATETEPQSYQTGDIVYQNGQAFVFDGVKFNAQAVSENELESRSNDIMAKLDTPLSAFEHKVSASDFQAACDYFIQTAQHRFIPEWAARLHKDLSRVAENKREAQLRRVLVGLSVQYVMDNFAGENQTENHADLSDAMKLRVALDKNLSGWKKAIAAIALHYDRKTGFSAAWRGATGDLTQELTTDKKVEQLQYLGGTLALPAQNVRDLGIEPMTNDDWCVNADGTECMKADDYFVGNLKDVLDKIDADIQAAANDDIRAKLQRMRQIALEKAPVQSVDNMRFGLRSPFVDNQALLRFVQGKLSQSKSSLKARLEQQASGAFAIVIDGTTKTENDKLLKRIGAYLESGRVSHQGVELTNEDGKALSDSEKLKLIRENVNEWNAEFDTWLKADKAFMQSVADKANDPANIRFPQTDDDAPLAITGANADVKLHGYQNAYIRKAAREFAPINAFGVGLGKTFTGLAAAQYALETGTKRKVCFVVPNAVLSNWHKESGKYYNENEREKCLFIGADWDDDGGLVVNSKNYARDLNRVLENRHNKIFMTQQAFEKIRLREETAQDYINYIGRVDNSFAEKQNAAKNEKAQAKAENLAADIAGKNKLDNAPFFEDLGIDAVVVDEAHHFKNAKQAIKVAQVKGLPSGKPSNRAIDMAVKLWFIRGNNPRNDGAMLLTATPVTNSPLEIYSMMSLAIGEERVNQAFLGSIKGADDFIEAICEIQSREEVDMKGDTVSAQSLVGIKNLALVQQLIGSNADIKEAQDVGIAFKQVDSEEMSDGVLLDDVTRRELEKAQNAYRIAKMKIKDQPISGESAQALADFQAVLEEVGKLETVAHPFSTIKRMSAALLDTALLANHTVYNVSNIEAAQAAVEAFNSQAKITFKTEHYPENNDWIVSETNRKNAETGELTTIYAIKAVAEYADGKVTLNCQDFNAQLKLEALLDKHSADVSVNISPKIAALVENVKKEQAHIRYAKARFAKQIIFVESLAMHTKIKRIIARECGIPTARITFISGQFNSDPDEIIDVQERFNGDDEDGYSIIIANKKAEVGINLQKGCQAIHHLELNWTPDSITQRNGRGIRQGNTAEKVNVYFYEVDGTFDTYKRTAINRKSNWIDSVMKQSSDDYAEVGQELTAEDYDEMIAFDGSASSFEAMLQRQTDRKQAEINRQAIAAQNVNIRIIRQSTKWLNRNPSDIKRLLNELNEAQKDNDALTDANKRLAKSIEKSSAEKTIAKNQKTRDIAYQRMEQWVERLSGVMYDDEPVIRVMTDEDKKGYYYAKYEDFHIRVLGYSRKEELFRLPENHIIAQEWQTEHDKQTALRESASANAKQSSHIDGATADFVIDALGQGIELFTQDGEYYPIHTIVLDDEKVKVLSSAKGNLSYYYGYESVGVHKISQINVSKSRILRPDDVDYVDGLKALAKWQSDAMRYAADSSRRYYADLSSEYPSALIDNVLDYLDNDVK
ncbi:N-6 DNA methylase [Kingella negevensis]|uniref:LPD3 domain-containing protein n=1 Tax=Kingella negevensis TaxID=1522312 RepID=UPI00254CCEF5|nr:N-6 DNA methylase [Kingella negevensis]MDK4688654.1 N-6 DNA methylase [Kingella negevensis]